MLALLLLPVAALSSPGESRLARPGRTVAEIEAQLRRAFDVAFRQPRTLSVRTVVDRTGSREPGTFEMIDVSLTGGRIDMLPVDTALLRFHRVQLDLDALFDQGNLVLLSRSPVDLRLVVTEAGLNEVLSLKHQNLAVEEPHLSIKNGKVHFAGRIRKFLNSRVSTAGTFAVKGGNQVHFLPTSLAVGVLPVPRPAVNALARRLNPIFDLGRFQGLRGLSCQLARIELRGDSMVVESEGAAEF